jgi:microcystin-dependent protein
VRGLYHFTLRDLPVTNLNDEELLARTFRISFGCLQPQTVRRITMADPFVAEIRIFPFNFAPKGWAWCDGQLLPLSQNTALFSLLGTTYGGDGKSNFALPDMQGNAPMHPGQGPGLSLHDLGETGGSDTVTLLESEIPSHNHNFVASQADGISRLPAANLAANMIGVNGYAAPGPIVAMDPNALTPAGGDQPHNNLMPYLTLYFNIALQGVFPPRT